MEKMSSLVCCCFFFPPLKKNPFLIKTNILSKVIDYIYLERPAGLVTCRLSAQEMFKDIGDFSVKRGGKKKI